jgi:hypothetical protein
VTVPAQRGHHAGAGIQVHIEDLAAHIAGRERCDADARWEELRPSYEALASKLS